MTIAQFNIEDRIILAVPSTRGYHPNQETRDLFEWTDASTPVPQAAQDIAARATLLTVADPWSHVPTEEEVRSFLTPRKQALVKLMATRGITAGDDYQYEDDYELIEEPKDVGRFVAIYGDETYNQIYVTDKIEEALAALSGLQAEQYCNVPQGVFDLDTGKEHGITTTTTLREPLDEPQQRGTHRKTVTIVWNEVVSYSQDIEIDVPDGYTGNLGDLIDVNDMPDSVEDDDSLTDIPAGYTSKWLDRADFSNTVAVSSRDITDVRPA